MDELQEKRLQNKYKTLQEAQNISDNNDIDIGDVMFVLRMIKLQQTQNIELHIQLPPYDWEASCIEYENQHCNDIDRTIYNIAGRTLTDLKTHNANHVNKLIRTIYT